MANVSDHLHPPSKSDKSKAAARKFECDDEARFDQRVRKVVRQKPTEAGNQTSKPPV